MAKNPVIDILFESLTESTQENQILYRKIARNYDKSYKSLSLLAPTTLANTVSEYFSASGRNSKDLYTLDVCSGTGLCGEALRKVEWLGVIDGVDGCKEMLEVAQTKGIYRTLYHQLISAESPLPIQNSSYDLVTCTGGLSFGHLPYQCLEMLLDILVPGGLLAINVSSYKNPGSDVKYQESVEKTMKQLLGKCTLVKEVRADVVKDDTRYSHGIEYEQILCYQKDE